MRSFLADVGRRAVTGALSAALTAALFSTVVVFGYPSFPLP